MLIGVYIYIYIYIYTYIYIIHSLSCDHGILYHCLNNLCSWVLDCAIGRVQVNQDELTLNGTHQLLVYADDVNILRESVHIIKENAEALVVVSEENRLEVDADKSKYMVMSRYQNAGRSHSMKTDNSFFEMVEEFKYIGTTLTNQNSI